jgi:hypothetical protein
MALAVVGTAERQSGTISTSTFVGAYVLASTGTAYSRAITWEARLHPGES